MKRMVAILGSLAALLTVSPSAYADILKTATLSMGDPVASCPVPAAAYDAAEVEPYVSTDPRDNGRLLAVWQQDRFESGGGSRGIVAASSGDDGRSWHRTLVPVNRCVAGGLEWDRASDPWVDFGPDGTAYLTALLITQGAGAAIATTISHDGGTTWVNTQIVFSDGGPDPVGGFYVPDKPTITADPNTPGTAYLTFTRFAYQPDCLSGTDPPCWPTTAPTYFAKTTDGGTTWSQPQLIVPALACDGADSNQIVVDPVTGAIHDVFSHELHTVPAPGCISGENWDHFTAEITTSFDGGSTWTPPTPIADEEFVGASDPDTGGSMADSPDNMTHAAVDPKTGALYVAWQDARWTGGAYDEIALSTSSDGGITWTSPIRANKHTGRPAFVPTVAVKPNGTVGVSYYDFRTLVDGNTTTLPTTAALHQFAPALAADLGDLVLTKPFDAMQAPQKDDGWFLGDYQGLVSDATGFRAVLAVTTSQPRNPTDIIAVVAG